MGQVILDSIIAVSPQAGLAFLCRSGQNCSTNSDNLEPNKSSCGTLAWARELLSQPIHQGIGMKKMDVRDLAPGIYIVSVVIEGEARFTQLISISK